MKTLREIVDSGSIDDIKINSTLNERLGPAPLFPDKIERIKTLVKGTVLDPAAKAKATEESPESTPA